jgi:paraquat-inducible protein B
MSKQANPTKIGFFIVLGLGLGLAGLIVFGSARLFTRTHQFILYFNDSLNGLSEGAPVKYRGVTIGSVKHLMIHFNEATNDYAMPVLVEVREDLIQANLGGEPSRFSDAAFAEWVREGMRASLQAESLVTGVLYIEMHPHSHAPEPVYHQLKPVYTELPTEATGIQQLMNNLASLDINGMVDKINVLISRLDTTVSGLKMEEISHDLTNVLVSVNELVRSPQITYSLAELAATLDQYHALGQKLNQRVDPVADSLTNTLAEAARTLAQLRGGAEDVRTLLTPDSPLRNNLDQALQQLAGASQSIASLAEYLKAHPNALITGRKNPPASP